MSSCRAIRQEADAASGTITDADWSSLVKTFTEQGALDILFGACGMNYLNRFNDAMHSPSEDVPIANYHEVYGEDWTLPGVCSRQVTKRGSGL